MMCVHCGQEDCDEGFMCPKAPRGPSGHEVDIPSPQYDKGRLGACGEGSFVSANIELRRPKLTRIGKHSNVDSGLYCTTQLLIGDYVHLAPHCTVIGGKSGLFRMSHFSTLGAGSRIVCGSDARADGEGLVGPAIPAFAHAKVDSRPVIFEPLAIGTTAIIVLPGVTLGMGCLIGAGSLVTESTEPWTVYVGSPARPIRTRPRVKILELAKQLGYEW